MFGFWAVQNEVTLRRTFCSLRMGENENQKMCDCIYTRLCIGKWKSPCIDPLADNDKSQLYPIRHLPFDEVRLEDPVNGSNFLVAYFLDLTLTNAISV
jgi:hypothetical protein